MDSAELQFATVYVNKIEIAHTDTTRPLTFCIKTNISIIWFFYSPICVFGDQPHRKISIWNPRQSIDL